MRKNRAELPSPCGLHLENNVGTDHLAEGIIGPSGQSFEGFHAFLGSVKLRLSIVRKA